MFHPNGSHKKNRPWSGGRGPGNIHPSPSGKRQTMDAWDRYKASAEYLKGWGSRPASKLKRLEAAA